MPISSLFKRRQVIIGGAGMVGLLGGTAITEAINIHTSSVAQSITGPSMQENEPYLNPGTFDQRFLAKQANVKQIWDFASIEQLQSDSITPIKNAMNDFQFTYHKSLYTIICLRGSAVIYGLDSGMWMKYGLSKLSGQEIDINPLYDRVNVDNGELSPEDPKSLYQDSSLQALQQRGSQIVVCHQALTGQARQLTERLGLTGQSVFKELAAHLVPGAQQTPSGSSLIAVAQHLGFTYAKQ